MKKPNFIFILVILGIFTFSACKDNGPDIEPGFTLLNYDGSNQDAPELPAGTYEGGARFLSTLMAEYTGDTLTAIQYYLQDVPKSGEIRIYSGSDNDTPKDLIYNKNVTLGRDQDAWNTHTLSDPIALDGSDLWIIYRFSHDNNARVFGCDIGPAVDNGEWLLDTFDGQWLPFSQRATLSINWNIRAVIDN